MGLYPKQELIKKNYFSCINVDPKYLFGTNSENICQWFGRQSWFRTYRHQHFLGCSQTSTYTENIFCRVTTFHTGACLLLDGLEYSCCITRSQPLYSQTRTVLKYSAEPQPFTSMLACYWGILYMLHYMKVNHLTLTVHDSINTFNIT